MHVVCLLSTMGDSTVKEFLTVCIPAYFLISLSRNILLWPAFQIWSSSWSFLLNKMEYSQSWYSLSVVSHLCRMECFLSISSRLESNLENNFTKLTKTNNITGYLQCNLIDVSSITSTWTRSIPNNASNTINKMQHTRMPIYTHMPIQK